MVYESVDWFSKAVDEDPTHIVALLHMADAYRSLKNVSAERAALRVMAQGSLNLTASHGDKALSSSNVYEASLSEALYILGFRLLAAGLDEEAADIFDSFIREYNVADDTEWTLTAKPRLSQMYVEAAHAQLRARRHTRCDELVDAVLTSAGPHLSEQSGGNISSPRKTCATTYFGSLLRAVSSMYLKEDVNEEAEDTFRRMLSAISLLLKEDGTPELSRGCEEHQWLLELVSQVYGNLSVLRLRRGLNMDALHSLKASLLAWPDNLDSLYNYVLLLLKLEKNRKALQVWNTAKGRGLTDVLNGGDSSYWEFNVTLDRLKVMDAMLAST